MSNPTKTSSKAIQHRFKIRSGAVPGALGETWGPFWFQDGPRLKNGTNKPWKSRFFWYQDRDSDQLVVVLFPIVCESALFASFCLFWVPEASISAFFLPSLWNLWAFGKTVESVVSVVDFRGLTPPRRSLFAALGCGCVSMMILLSICLVCCCFGFPFWAFFRLASCWKPGLKPMQKTAWKGERRSRG